jgi:hypothetical protein
MRRRVIRGVVVVLVLAAAWLVAGRWGALLIDEVHTARLATLYATPIGWDGNSFQLSARVTGTLGPSGLWLSPFRWDSPQERVTMQVDADGNLVLIEGGRRFVMGKRAGTMLDTDQMPAFEGDPDDKTMFTLDLGLVSWPTPLDINWMGGRSPLWRRYLYGHLLWEKASGARLDLYWRYEQGYYSEGGWGWADPMGGLVRVDIRPRGHDSYATFD